MKRKRAKNPAMVLNDAYGLMLKQHGHQKWWPGDTPFEICVGAILTQNTSWTNVERAIANLKRAKALEPKRLYELPIGELAELLRPAGYFNVKTQRLRCFLKVLIEEFGTDLNRLFAGPTSDVRARLLSITGIGPETADSMLLYAGGHHSFVIDAYTKRIFQRHGWWQAQGKGAQSKANSHDEYHSLKGLCETSLPGPSRTMELDYWQDYHAQLVMVGKNYCRPREARCSQCPLQTLLPGRGPLEKVKRS